MRCSAILVNYRTAKLIVEAVRCLDVDSECTEIYVVDNSETTEDKAYLLQHLPAKVHLVVPERNLGFAGACNLVFEQIRTDSVLLLNPDARLMTGALAKLKTFLREHPNCAAVAPKVFWDEQQSFQLPPSTFPSRKSVAIDKLAHLLPKLFEYQSYKFRQRAIDYWRSESAVRVEALSGGHVLLRYSAVKEAGGLFDPRFFMYWEDSDLMWRLKASGGELWMTPEAAAIHLYEHHPGKDNLLTVGWHPFQEKYFSSWPWRALDQLIQRIRLTGNLPTYKLLPPPEIQGSTSIPIRPEWQNLWLIEVSPSPWMIPSIGLFGSGETAIIDNKLLNRFSGRNYFLRAGGLNKKSMEYFIIQN